MLKLTPREIVAELDKYIIGQDAAKKCVAIALRNRYRRRQLSEDMREEILPKNIIMIGPTGVGKTEIAKRMAKIADAPFVKVEATKFTEVGYVGRDVESIIRDLVETSIRLVRSEKMAEVKERGQSAAEMRLLDLLSPLPTRRRVNQNYTSLSTGTGGQDVVLDDEEKKRNEDIRCRRVFLRDKLSKGELDHEFIEMEIEEQNTASLGALGEGMEGMGINVQGILGSMMPKKRKKQKVSIAEARKIITQEETEKLIQMDEVVNEAIDRAEQSGIVFIDEIDKIAGKDSYGPDISRGGVQRDILPIVEGSTVMTKHGPIKTDHILFIAAGAFHISKPSDLIPELQGRFPIRVELECLNVEVLRRILMEPHNSLIRQYKSLLAADGVEIIFTDDGIDALAEIADKVNLNTENIGARRLHTILEKVLDEIAFNAPDEVLSSVSVDRAYVESKLSDIAKNDDLSRFIL